MVLLWMNVQRIISQGLSVQSEVDTAFFQGVVNKRGI